MRVPRFELQTIEDEYTYYVDIIGIPSDIFWTYPISTVVTIAENKAAYDGWVLSEKRKAADRQRKRK